MKIKSVSIAGMHHIASKTYEFNDINYLHGPNGAGKSTVLNAIQLAILGYIPGTAKQTAAIFQHASQPEMEIKVTFDDDRYIKRRWTAKGKSVVTTVTGSFDEDSIPSIIGDLELPIFNFSELMGLTANKLKDWFINFLPPASMQINWKEELIDSLKGMQISDDKLLPSALTELETNDGRNLIEKIQAFNSQMKANQTFLKSEISRSEATIQSLIYYDEEGIQGDDEYLEGEIQKCQSRISELTSEKERMIQANQIIASNNRARSMIAAMESKTQVNVDELKTRRDNILSSINDLESSVQDEKSQLIDKTIKKNQIQSEIDSRNGITRSGGICPYTNTSCESIASMVAKFMDEINQMESEIATIDSEYAELQSSLQKKQQAVQDLKNQLRMLDQQISDVSNAQTSLENTRSMIQPEPDMTQFNDTAFYSQEIDRLNTQISKIRANQQYNKLIDTLTSGKYGLENSLEVYKCWAKLTDPNGLQTKVMDAPFKNLAEEMNKYLQIMFSSDVKCNFNLEQRANSFSFGINRSGRYIPYDLLSSGEKTMFALALMLCIVDKSSSDLKILIVDDMLDHLDNSRADEVFKSLGQVQDIQVIVAGVKESANTAQYIIEVTK